MHFKNVLIGLIIVAIAAQLAACQTTYYAVWEKLGKEKRDLLREQIELARNDHEQASEEFKDALTRLKQMYGYSGGDLEKIYGSLSSDYEDVVERVDIVDERVNTVQRISSDLFAEWRAEIDEIAKPEFRAASLRKLKATQAQYKDLEKAMRTARKRMTPVVVTLKDYVLYLKHNLNAQAIGSLRSEVSEIEADIALLVRDIQKSIQAADAFLADYNQ